MMTANRNWTANNGAVIALSAAAGFVVSAVVLPTWTDNVESAQVVAGLVRLPADNPMRLFHLSIISILIDSAALLLKLGVSEWVLSVMYSGLQGALAFAAVTSCCLALSAGRIVALLVPVLLIVLQVHNVDSAGGIFGYWPASYLQSFHGHTYPVLFPNHMSTYGVCGLFGVMLVWAVFAMRYYRTAAFLGGILPWFHPTLALACWIGAGWGVLAWRNTELRERRVRLLLIKWFATGLVLAAAGMAAHMLFVSPAAGAMSSEAAELFRIYAKNWGDHSIFTNWPLWKNAALLEIDFYVMGLMALIVARSRWLLTPAMRFIIISHVAVTVCAVVFLVVSICIDHLPQPVQALLANRWLNLNSVAFPVLVFSILGYLGFEKRNTVAAVVFFVNVLMILFLGIDSLTLSSHLRAVEGGALSLQEIIRGLLFPVLGGGGAGVLLLFHPRMERRGRLLDKHRYFRPLLTAAAALVIAAAVFFRVAPRFSCARLAGNDEWTPLMKALSKGDGFYIASDGVWLRLQLRTRRGILIDPCQVNFLSYVPRVVPSVESILNTIYKSSLTVVRSEGELFSIQQWPMRSLEEWQQIREEYTVTNILLPEKYHLRLPVVFRAATGYNLYYIPAPPGGGPEQSPPEHPGRRSGALAG